MGKHSNAQGLRLLKKKNWSSKFYSDSFNYSTILGQDFIIRDYVINFLNKLKIYVCDLEIKRSGSGVIINIRSYNDYSTFAESFISRYVQKIKMKRSLAKDVYPDTSRLGKLYFSKKKRLKNKLLPSKVFYSNKGSSLLTFLDCLNFNNKTGFSMRRLLTLNLSYFLKTNVVVRNVNIMNKSAALLDLFWSLTYKLRSPLPKHLSLKLIYLVYHSLQHKSALLLCRYLAVLLPRFCKKKRKNRKINPFLHYLKKLIKTLFSNGFCDKKNIKGLKIVLKGRLNGSRRKTKYVIEYGRTTVQSLKDQVSYHQEHCYTLFGVSGIKVWIIS